MSSVSSVPTITLNNDTRIPQFGFGVFQISPAETAQAVNTALASGYRHIDTAQMYGNEREVGQALAESGLRREDIFVTTKLNNDRHSYDSAVRSLEESLGRLGSDYVDLFLIHWPLPQLDRYVEAWKALEAVNADGRARAIGVSNFQPWHLDRLGQEADTVPAVNQIELHPYLQQTELREYHRTHGIATEAWAPIAKGRVLDEPYVRSLAENYGKTPAQIVLRWHIELGDIVFPKSVTPARISENIDIFDFELTEQDIEGFAQLERGTRTGPNPDSFGR